MSKDDLKELSPESLEQRRTGNIRRYLITLGLIIIFSLYLGYLDFIKKSGHDHTETFILIAIGVVIITIELVYRTRKISSELKSREKK